MQTNREWVLKARPSGLEFESCLELREGPLPEPGEGQVRVRNVYLSLEPATRLRMQRELYGPALPLGAVVTGFSLGVVEASRFPGLREGAVVAIPGGWRAFSVVNGADARELPPGIPLPAWFSALGHIGLSAWFGLMEVGQPKPGETVVVSAAAGAVGSQAGQLARIHGCRAVGIAGSDEKCAWLTGELGFDAAVNYKRPDWEARLREACPQGVDVYFENVGGAVSEPVYALLNKHARVSLCGLISGYNDPGPTPGPKDFSLFLMKRVRLEGFIVSDYFPRANEAYERLVPWVREGRLKWRADVAEGLESVPTTFRKLFVGGNTGKLQVKVSEP